MHKKKADISASLIILFSVRICLNFNWHPLQRTQSNTSSDGGVGDDVGSDADVSTGTTFAFE